MDVIIERVATSTYLFNNELLVFGIQTPYVMPPEATHAHIQYREVKDCI